MEISLIEQTFLYLLNSAVNEKAPEKLPEDLDYEELFRLSRFHSVSSMVSYALDKGGYLTEQFMPKEMIQKWASARINAMRKNLMFDTERKQIFQYMEEQGIWYMPLKGIILKEMYPDVGMREMCDNDVLFDEKYRKQVRDYMVGRGYETISYMRYIHDIYMKKPFYNYEFHAKLFGECSTDNWSNYYSNVEERLYKDEAKNYKYYFKDEDFYIYITAHAYKHYREGGTGIRSFVDTYVYLKEKEDTLDWDYIEQETVKMGTHNFEKDARMLVKYLFAPTRSIGELFAADEKEAAMISYILHAGTYGTQENKVKNGVIDAQTDTDNYDLKGKLKYCLKRIYPGMEHIKNHHPFLYKHQWLIPFFWIYRLINRPIKNWKRLMEELKMLINLK